MNHLTLLLGAYVAVLNSRSGNVENNLSEWQSFKQMHNKTYEDSTIDSLRSSIFAHNKHYVEMFNSKKSAKAGFELGLNHLSDLSEFEMKMRNGYKRSDNPDVFRNTPEAEKFLNDILSDESKPVPDEVDWRKVAGRVSRVKDQDACGSCWAFASTGALEGQEKIREAFMTRRNNNNTLVELSEQNLVDCVSDAAGCDGGWMKDAFAYVKKQGGIDDEYSYPYDGQNLMCRFKKNSVAFSDNGAAILPEGDEEKLKQVVAKFGPVAVGIDASSPEFHQYKKGVFYGEFCRNDPKHLNHAVLVVGYGTDPNDPEKGDYWIVKNSWSKDWGDGGYILMSRNMGNNCGIATEATIPIF